MHTTAAPSLPTYLLQLLVSLVFLSLNSGTLLSQEHVRTWKVGKFEIVGSIKSTSDTEIVLKTRHRESTLPIESLSEDDKAYLRGLKIIRYDAQQFSFVESNIARFTKTRSDGIEFFVKLSREQRDSPYASIASGLAMATQKGDFKGAKRQFLSAVKTIDRNQQILGEGFHAYTQAAAHNNIAICLIKTGKSSEAVEELGKALKFKKLCFQAFHNAQLLLQVSGTPGAAASLRKRQRSELIELIESNEADYDLIESNLPPRYLICTAWDEPLTELTLSRLVELDGKPFA